MKVMLMVSSVAIMLMTCPLAQANLVGIDDFNDNSKDTSLWGDDITTDDMGITLSETNQAVYMTGTADVGQECDRMRPWIKNTGSPTEDWSVQVEVNMPNIALGESQGLGLGLRADLGIPNDEDEDYAYVYLWYGRYGESPWSGRNFVADVSTDHLDDGPTFAATSSTSAAVRLHWDASDATLYTQYDSDGAANGFSWTTLGSADLAGGKTGWDMPFGVGIRGVLEVAPGGTSSITISQGDEVKMDNFNAVPEPSSFTLLAIGALALLGYAWRRRRAA